MLNRFANNPIVTPADVKPSAPDLEVMCAFNAGATVKDGETLLLIRVAERPQPVDGYVSTAVMDPDDPENYRTLRIKLDDPDLVFSDPRVFEYKGELYLTSISHLRLARSTDGRHFTIDAAPAMRPTLPTETYGIEDPRITFIDGAWYINYSAISLQGVCTALARTTDFIRYEKLGIIFAPDNKDIAIFPEPINGRYYAFHRPSMKHIGKPSMWIAGSDNLLDWGQHRQIIAPRPGCWDCERVGCGAAPIKTEQGWLAIYHASDQQIRYRSGLVLLDLEEPWKVIARSDEPILSADCEYEQQGLLPSVVFHNGLALRDDGTVDIYYGAGDVTVCGASAKVSDLLASLL